MRLRRFSTTLIFIVPLLLLTAIAVKLVRDYYHQAERDLRPILEQELTQTLGHEVKVGKVTLKDGYAYLDDVRIAQGKTLAESGEIARAKQIVVDIDLRRILLSKDKTLPLFAHATVIEPVGHARRDANGRWNFEDLFKPRQKPPSRPGIGTVTITRGTLYYEDRYLQHHARRPQSLVIARFDNANGTLEFYASRGATWEIRATGADVTGPTAISGSYDPLQPQLLVRVETTGLRMPILSRFLPPDTNITAGVASGRVTVTRTLSAAGKPVYDYQSDIRYANATLVSSRVAEPVTGLRGGGTVANDLATVRADGLFAGSALHAEGTVLGFTNPSVVGWAQGDNLQLGRALTALKLDQKIPALRQVAASASVRANLRGPLSNPTVTASGPAQVRGALPGGVNVGESGRLQIAFAGTLDDPRVILSGTLPSVKYQNYSARDVQLSAVYDGRANGRGAVDFQGKFGGGTLAGRAMLSPAGRAANAPRSVVYRVTARARNVDLAALPFKTAAGNRPAGVVTGDIVASGRTGDTAVAGDARLSVLGLNVDGWGAQQIQARVHADGQRATLEPAVITDPKGTAIVTGSVGMRDRSLDLRAQVDSLDLAVWPAEELSGAGRQPLAPLPTTGPAVAGLVFLRDVSITGTSREPVMEGRMYAYDLRSERLPTAKNDETPMVDYLVTDFHGDRSSFSVSDGRAYRFPSVATFNGLIQKPLSTNPRLDLFGEYRQVDVTDLATLAGISLDASGLVQGRFEVLGVAQRPEIALPDLSVQSARIGDYDFQKLTASLRYSPFEEGGLWTLDSLSATHARVNVPPEQWTTLSASGTFNGQKRFRLHATADRVGMDLLEPYVSDWVTLDGTGEATADISGRVRDGKPADLSGDLAVRTRGFAVNRVSLGDLHGQTEDAPARFSFRDDRVTSSDLVVGSVDSGVFLTGAAAAPGFVYDVDTDALRVNGGLAGIGIDLLRQAITNSPYVAEHPESVAARWLKPITNPFEGTIGGTFAVRGTSLEPATDFSWFTTGARIQGNPIDAFKGSVTFARNRIDLKEATLTAGSTDFTASGSLVPGREMTGNVDTVNMPISLVRQWFPGRPVLRDLEGVAESVHLTAAGDPANPSLTASVLFRDVTWIETADPDAPTAVPAETLVQNLPTRNSSKTLTPADLTPTAKIRVVRRVNRAGHEVETTTTGRELWVSEFDTSIISINAPANPGRIVADNVHLTLREPDPLPPVAGAARPVLKNPRLFRIYVKGESQFDWQNLDVLKDPRMRLEVNVPQQEASALLALAPRPPDTTEKPEDIAGTVRANLIWTGTLHAPSIQGGAAVAASRIHFPGHATQIRDLNAELDFTGDSIQVRNFTGYTEIIEPRTGRVLQRSDPITVTGGISLTDESGGAGTFVSLWPPRISTGSELHVVAERLKLAEGAIMGLRGSRFVTDDTRIDVTASGSLLKPLVRGDVVFRKADVKLPDNFEGPASGPEPIFQPSFDMRFTLGDQVRVVSPPLSAAVHTPTGSPIVLRGDILHGDPTRLRLDGSLVVKSGTLAFPTARFTLLQGGRVTLRYPYIPFGIAGAGGKNEPTLGIILDIKAQTRLTASPANNPNLVKRYTITVEARGPLNSGAPVTYQDSIGFGTSFLDPGLQLTFRSDPPDFAFSDAQMRRRITGILGGESAIQALVGNRPDLGRAVREQVTTMLSDSFLPGLLESTGFARALGLEEFSVDVSQLNAFSLRLSRQLFGPIYLSYWRRLSGPETTLPGEPGSWQFKLSYRFRPQLQFSWTTDDQRTNAYLIEGVFRFW